MLKPATLALLAGLGLCARAADSIQHLNSYQQVYGATKSATDIDPAKDLPRYPAVEPKDAVATWKVKRGFRIELAVKEPQTRDPIAVTFDENGRMFVCEMIDYSERRDEIPHLGRISVLEDKDGDGVYESSHVFADNLPWPTGLLWANGGLYVGATPDIWRFEDRDGDGVAEVREKVFTGFGTGLQRLNVQAMLNSFSWGQDNRIHVQSSVGNRGKISCLKRPDLPAEELASRDFWFDPRTYEWGFEAGGAQYGMSFDNYGRKFGCSNSDHLQFWVYDDRYAQRNPFFQMPSARQSIAADGGAAEVYRISPDEPWRIIRTRWRIGGVVKGAVEGGGRVSGYFTGATGTMVYRGDAYGPDFEGNTFSGDAGGQLVHRKKIHEDGVSLIGRRPDDEPTMEFAASTDTWVRVVNFANAPDGCLHVIDMYREVIEHPWSLPEEIKRHLDLNAGNDRGRIYRIVPDNAAWQRRNRVTLGSASTAELVATLAHPNGWHRDTASRLLYERQDKASVPLLAQLIRESKSAVGRHHALGVLDGLGRLDEAVVTAALADADAHVRERAVALAEKLFARTAAQSTLAPRVAALAGDTAERVCFQVALSAESMLAAPGLTDAARRTLAAACGQIARRDYTSGWISSALLSGPASVVGGEIFALVAADPGFARQAEAFTARLIEIRAATKPGDGYGSLVGLVAAPGAPTAWLRALGEGVHRAVSSIEAIDSDRKLAAVFTRASATATEASLPTSARLAAIEVLAVATPAQSKGAFATCMAAGQADEVQAAAVRALGQQTSAEVTATLLKGWSGYGAKAKEAALALLVAREDRATALLQAIQKGTVPATDLAAAQIQSLTHHKSAKVIALARTVLAAVIPPSREEVIAKYQPAAAAAGDAARGKSIFLGRCSVCHRAGGEGMQLGPDLNTVKSKGRDGLLTAILDPHKEVAPQYIAYEVNTKDGNAFSGIITRDEATSLTLKIMGGAEVTLPRSNIKGSSSSGKSLMPEGLESGLSVQEMADLLSFIESL
jgi:putative membrane-bound dehydrogenase-like protein